MVEIKYKAINREKTLVKQDVKLLQIIFLGVFTPLEK